MRLRSIAKQAAFVAAFVLLLVAMTRQVASAQTDTAEYAITFDATWSAETHPHPDGNENFPGSSAHFSPLIGAVHAADISLWQPDALASAGIEQMAETGGTSALRSEIGIAVDAGDALAVVSGGGPDSPGMTTIDGVTVTEDFPVITLVTMIAPSPDWFVGVNGLSLLDGNGEWQDEVVVTLYPYDAGTDSGADYGSANEESEPADPIGSLRNQFPFSDAPIGTFTFQRIGEPVYRIYLPVVE